MLNNFNIILNKKFSTSQSAIEYCQYLAHACGFGVRIRTSKENTIYIVCSREGKPDLKAKNSLKRNRSSERCNCGWRIVLYHHIDGFNNGRWEFREGKTMIHNHPLFTDDMVEDIFTQTKENNYESYHSNSIPRSSFTSSIELSRDSPPSNILLYSPYSISTINSMNNLPSINHLIHNSQEKDSFFKKDSEILPTSLQFILN